ncbi:MAG: metallophosphoesterase [Spirochaetales bacterium]|nr:metallophosphoesterase [Spirochaetales bacterium]
MASSIDPKSHERLNLKLSHARHIPWSPKGRWVIFSDLHMGDGGKRDDFASNADLFSSVLTQAYPVEDWNLILNGDVEELYKFTWRAIKRAWPSIYSLFDTFHHQGKLYKTVGNHDARLILDLKESSPYPMDTVLRMTGTELPILIYHGHQVSTYYDRFNDISRIGVRYFAMPLGIMNRSVSHSSRKRHSMEQRIYTYSRRQQLISIIGHTHRPLFESLSKPDTLRFRIEALLLAYRKASVKKRPPIEEEILDLKSELAEWSARKHPEELSSGIYAAGNLPVPCVFNSGTVLGKRGMTCLEIADSEIRLVHWIRTFPQETTEENEYQGFTRQVLRKADMDYVMTSMRLLS